MQVSDLSVFINQVESRYHSTGDYFKMVANDLGCKMSPPYDVCFNMSPGEIEAGHQLYLNRDCHLGLEHRVPDAFYTQYSDSWPDEKVVMHAARPQLHKRTREPEYDVVFVGRNDESLYKERNEILKYLSDKVDIRIIGDGRPPKEYVDCLSLGKIIFNFSLKGEINRRVFEGMAIGTLVTDAVRGLDHVGKEGEDFYSYKRDDYEGALRAIKKALDKPIDSRKHIINNHTYKHRFLQMLKGII